MKKVSRLRYILSIFGLIIIGAAPLFLTVPQAAAAPTLPAYRYTNTPIQSGGFVAAGHVMTDSQGDTYVAGVFSGTVNFAGSLGNDTITSNVYDTYLTRYNADNSYGWTRVFDNQTNGGSAQTSGIAIDAGGNVYVAGAFSGGVIFDGPGGSDLINANGNGSSTYLTKYTANGSYAGTRTVIAPFGQTVNAAGLAIDPSGRIVMAGNFNGTVDFDPGNATDNQTDAGGNGNVFVSVYNADGSYAWTRTLDTTAGGGVQDAGVVTASNGTIYLTGSLYGTVNFAGSSGTDTHTDPGNGTSFIMAYSPTGVYAWTRVFDYSGGSSYTYPTGIAIDASNNIYASGMFSGTVDFDASSGTDNQTDVGGSGNGYLVKYSPNGTYDWTKTPDTTPGGNAMATAVATDMNGDVYMLSAFSGAVNFAGSTGNDVQNQTNSGALTMYNPDGSYAWTRVFDTTNGTAVTTQGINGAVVSDRKGNVFVASQFTGTVVFDGAGGNDSRTASSQNGFLTSFQSFVPAAPVTSLPATNGAATIVSGQLTDSGLPVTVISLFAVMLMLASIWVRIWPSAPRPT